MAQETCRSQLEGHRHRLTVSLPSVPMYLDADPARIAQVLINLLDNAVKYTDPGGEIWLTAEAVRAASAGGTEEVIVRVRDTGIGISAELLPHIFEMFTQGDRITEQGRGGVGVGLTLVRSLVQMHGGTVEVKSGGPKTGSEFVVRLPLAEGARVPAAERKPAAPARTCAPKRILAVDDSRDQVESLAMLLRLMGHEVRVAESGAQALEIAAEFAPDVLLADIGLPDMNGYDVARRIRGQPRFRDVLLVAQTGWGQEEDRRRSQEAGFDFHLVKPVTLEALERILATLQTT